MNTEAMALVVSGMPRHARVHSPDCRTARGLEASGYGPYELIPVHELPADAIACRVCGGPTAAVAAGEPAGAASGVEVRR
jgi:hypothetical protein